MNSITASQISFFGSIAFSFMAWGGLISRFVWPILSRWNFVEALRPILILHSFRFIGLAFLVPGVVSLDLPTSFARSAAYGDVVAAGLALLSLLMLPNKSGFVASWLFNLWGLADLLMVFFEGYRGGLLAGQLGAAYFIPTLFVPLWLITHGLAFRILLGQGRDLSQSIKTSRNP